MEKSKLWFWILFDVMVVVGIITLFSVSGALSRWGSALAPARTITVSAQGKTTGTPDLAVVSFSVVTQGNNPTELSNSNNDKMKAVMQFVKSQGIADQDAKTTSYDLQPNYQYDRVLQRNYITGYTLTQTVEVKVRDLTKVATILGGLAPLGVNQIGGVDFTFDNPDNLTAAARVDAMQKAKDKGMAMAGQAGASLGEVVNMNESTYIPYFAKSVYGMGAGAMAESAAMPPINPGTQDITDTVTVTYELR